MNPPSSTISTGPLPPPATGRRAPVAASYSPAITRYVPGGREGGRGIGDRVGDRGAGRPGARGQRTAGRRPVVLGDDLAVLIQHMDEDGVVGGRGGERLPIELQRQPVGLHSGLVAAQRDLPAEGRIEPLRQVGRDGVGRARATDHPHPLRLAQVAQLFVAGVQAHFEGVGRPAEIGSQFERVCVGQRLARLPQAGRVVDAAGPVVAGPDDAAVGVHQVDEGGVVGVERAQWLPVQRYRGRLAGRQRLRPDVVAEQSNRLPETRICGSSWAVRSAAGPSTLTSLPSGASLNFTSSPGISLMSSTGRPLRSAESVVAPTSAQSGVGWISGKRPVRSGRRPSTYCMYHSGIISSRSLVTRMAFCGIG